MSSPDAPSRKVLWATTNTHHDYSPVSSVIRTSPPSATRSAPRSILKKTRQKFLDVPLPELTVRAATPEPEKAENDPDYLNGPIICITSPNQSFRDLSDAYSKLTTRLRAMANSILSERISLPALSPIIAHRDAFILSLERDIKCLLVETSREESENLPPQQLGKKGMSDEEAKRARDLYSLTLAALRLTSLIISSDRLQKLFTTHQVATVLTSLLAIPLSPTTPTHNSRKVYAVAISAISVAVLPHDVAEQAASRLTFALQRAVAGDLGREGKRGSIADGLKGVALLVSQHPQLFLNAFGQILADIFMNLFSATVQTKTLAAQALGSLAAASLVSPSSKDFDANLDGSLSSYYERLVGAMRASLTPDNDRAPWALCTLASLVTLGKGSIRTVRLAMNVVPLAMSSKKTGIKVLGSFIWRCLLRQLLAHHPKNSLNHGWDLLDQTLENGIGLGRICAHLAEGKIESALDIVLKMISKRQCSVSWPEAVAMLQRLVSYDAADEADRMWCPEKLTPKGLFDGTLLNHPYTSIGNATKAIYNDPAALSVGDIPPLTREEICEHWHLLTDIWKEAARRTQLKADGGVPLALAQIWQCVVRARSEDEDQDMHLQVSDVISSFLMDPDLVWKSDDPDVVPEALKYGFITNLWTIARDVTPVSVHSDIASQLYPKILDEEPEGDAVSSWSELFVQLTASLSEAETTDALFIIRERHHHTALVLETVYKLLLDLIGTLDMTWNFRVFLLSFPLRFASHYKPLLIDQELYHLWENALRISLMEKEDRLSLCELVEELAHEFRRCEWHLLLPQSSELLLGFAELDDPESWSETIHLCRHALQVAYSKATDADVMVKGRWLLTCLLGHIDRINPVYVLRFVAGIQEGICPWIEDREMIIADQNYEQEIDLLYGAILNTLEKAVSPVFEWLSLLMPLWLAPFRAIEMGHAERPSLNRLRNHLRLKCATIPFSDWPKELASYIRYEASDSPISTIEEQDRRAATVLSDLAFPTTPTHQRALPCNKLKRRASADYSGHYKRLKRDDSNENTPLTPLQKKTHTRLKEERQPLADITLLSTLPTSQHKKPPLRPFERNSGRLVLDCVSVPTLEQLRNDAKRTANADAHANLPTEEESVFKFSPLNSVLRAPNDGVGNMLDMAWPGSDDTLVGEPEIYSKAHAEYANVCLVSLDLPV